MEKPIMELSKFISQERLDKIAEGVLKLDSFGIAFKTKEDILTFINNDFFRAFFSEHWGKDIMITAANKYLTDVEEELTSKV